MYLVEQPKTFQIHVTLLGININGSPFNVQITSLKEERPVPQRVPRVMRPLPTPVKVNECYIVCDGCL
jgi:hypothetical protein